MSFEGQDRRSSAYRPEIDGLRAIAVLSVMAYHAGILGITGGFVGVDIFFVISGYLITGIILREKENGTFSLLHFWERRARRILPAMFTVILVCIPPAIAFLPPSLLQSFGASIASAITFVSNIYFWRSTGGYFDTSVESMPLIHLWSLSVEEQFYLLYPWVLLGLWRFARRWMLAAVIVGILCSLVLSEMLTVRAPQANFYILPSRGWELLTGAALAITARSCSPFDRFNGSLAWLGLLLIALPVILYNHLTPFPGLTAVPPVLGTALLIRYARPASGVGRLLASRPLVGIGLISYSAYLWHQPVLAFGRVLSFNAISPAAKGGLMVVAFALAWLTWKFVEVPFRKRSATRARVFLVSLAGGALLFAVGGALWWSGGLPQRLSERTGRIAGLNQAYTSREVPCFLRSATLRPEAACIRGKEGPVTIAIVGDSHAISLAPALEPALALRRERAILLTVTSCPTGTPDVSDDDKQAWCTTAFQGIATYLLAKPAIRDVVLNARWTMYLEGNGFDNDEGGIEGGGDLRKPNADAERKRRAGVAQGYKDFVGQLIAGGKRVILVYPVPEAGWDLPLYLTMAELRGVVPKEPLSTSHARFVARNRAAYAALDAIGTAPNLIRLYPEHALCNTAKPGRCILQDGRLPLYFDDDHLTEEGARFAVPTIGAALSPPAIGRK
jgi:peptidoglycan/LPS O-acetylase OafA/YrhL